MSSIYQTHRPTSGGGDFLKIKDGDKVKVRIASEPVGTLYKQGDKLRYAWVVWNREANCAQILTSGISIYNQIADIVEDWQEDPQEFDVTIKRTGSGPTDTSYSVTPVKKSDPLTKEQQEAVSKLDLPKLTKGRWLADIEEDGKLPEPVVAGEPPVTDEFGDEPQLDVNDVPF